MMKLNLKSFLFSIISIISICASTNVAFEPQKYIDIFIIAGEQNAIGYSLLSDEKICDKVQIQENVFFQMSWNVSKTEQYHSNLTSQLIPGTTSPLGADFFGPEFGFAARASSVNLTSHPLGFIKYVVGLSTIQPKNNDSANRLPSWDTNSVPEGECWIGLKNSIINGVKKYMDMGYSVNIKGFLWYLGESDGKFDFPVGTIGAMLEQLLDSLKNFLLINYGTDTQKFAVVLTRPGGYRGSPLSWVSAFETVKNKSGYIGLVDATPYSNPNSSQYLNGAAMWDLGQALADQMKLALLGCACMVGYSDVGQLTWPFSSCTGVCKRLAPQVSALDYAFWYYPTNQKPPTASAADYQHDAHFLTGYYGLAFNPKDQNFRFGILNDKMPILNATNRPNSIINDMISSIISFEAGSPQSDISAATMTGVGGSTEDRWSTRDAGKFMNQLNIVNVTYNNDDKLIGYVKIASAPRHFVFTHGITKNMTGMSSISNNFYVTTIVRIRVFGLLLKTMTNFTWLIPGYAIRLTDSKGIGWIFIVYDQVNTTTLLTYTPENGLIATRNVSSPQELIEISLLALPTTAIGPEELKLYLNPNCVKITSTLLDKNGGYLSGIWSTPMEAVWSSMHGVFQVPMHAISKAGGTSGQSLNTAPENWELHNLYNRHLIIVQTTGLNLSYGSAIIGPVAIPMCFGANNPNGNIGLSITAGIAFFRDSQGEPLGIQIQMSKDWHTCAGCGGSDGNLYYHLYSMPTFGGQGIDRFELTFANSRWGQAHVAQHSQLSLMGYNSRCGGHWQESSISPVGETITYDPDLTLGRAMIDDVRPFLNLGGNDLTQKWAWTGNVGGADFLSYVWNNYTVTGNTKRRLGRVRTNYEAHGPTLTNVGFDGISSDGAIQANIRTQLASSNDIVRCYYILDYTFLKDVDYYRLAFFQIAADGYMDNGYSQYAYGNALNVTFNGKVSDTWGNSSNKFSYANNDARGIPLLGTSPWVLLYRSTKRDATLADWPANIGFIVRSFKATIGDSVITTPHINIGGQSGSQVSFELGLPHNCMNSSDMFCGRFVPAGSRVQAVVEYVVLPAVKNMYYGFMDYMKQMPNSSYDNHLLMLNEAANNTLLVNAIIGSVRRNQPVEIDAASGHLAADIMLQGGVGWTPLTFHGLYRYDGWILQQWNAFSLEWMKIDQSYRGNDFWQTVFNQDSLSYSLTYVVPNENLQRYRLINQASINETINKIWEGQKIE